MDVAPFLIGAGVLQFSGLVLAACYGIAMENEDKQLGVACAIAAVLMTGVAYAVFGWGIAR